MSRKTQARAGDVIWNPLTGEKALLVESAEETGGARVVADAAVEEGGFVPGGEHVHDHQSEYFDVHEGRIVFLVNGEERTLGRRTIERYLDLDTHPSAQRGLGRLPEKVMVSARV